MVLKLKARTVLPIAPVNLRCPAASCGVLSDSANLFFRNIATMANNAMWCSKLIVVNV